MSHAPGMTAEEEFLFADQADLVMAPVCGTGERSSNLRIGTRA
jgi:hypothetical protein